MRPPPRPIGRRTGNRFLPDPKAKQQQGQNQTEVQDQGHGHDHALGHDQGWHQGRGGGKVRSADDFGRVFPVSRETLAKLETYVTLLKLWQKTINLVAPATLDHIWHRHVADSAQLLALAPKYAKFWVDLGSGGGFPGLVLGIMLGERPGARMTLVESDSRKAAFLREAARTVSAPVDILCGRIENVATQFNLASVDVVTARALAPLPRLLGLCRPLFGPTTIALLLKGRDAEVELAEAHAEWSSTWPFAADLVPSRTDKEGRIVVVRALEV